MSGTETHGTRRVWVLSPGQTFTGPRSTSGPWGTHSRPRPLPTPWGWKVPGISHPRSHTPVKRPDRRILPSQVGSGSPAPPKNSGVLGPYTSASTPPTSSSPARSTRTWRGTGSRNTARRWTRHDSHGGRTSTRGRRLGGRRRRTRGRTGSGPLAGSWCASVGRTPPPGLGRHGPGGLGYVREGPTVAVEQKWAEGPGRLSRVVRMMEGTANPTPDQEARGTGPPVVSRRTDVIDCGRPRRVGTKRSHQFLSAETSANPFVPPGPTRMCSLCDRTEVGPRFRTTLVDVPFPHTLGQESLHPPYGV